MPRRGNPNLARRDLLATELRRLRADKNMTGEEVRQSLGWSAGSKLSRIENGVSGIKRSDLEDLLDLYGVSDSHRAQLFALAEESQGRGWPSARTRIPDEHQRLLDAERDAASIQIWEPQLFPGLFQRPPYYRSMFVTWVTLYTMAPGEVDRRAEARRLRQDVLARNPPPSLTVVIDESVLYRCIGNAEVMHDQLEHVIELARLPQVEVRVLSLSGTHPVSSGAFTYFKFGQIHEIPQRDLVAFEQLAGDGFTDSEQITHQYAITFDALRQNALEPEDSLAVINCAVQERWTA